MSKIGTSAGMDDYSLDVKSFLFLVCGRVRWRDRQCCRYLNRSHNLLFLLGLSVEVKPVQGDDQVLGQLLHAASLDCSWNFLATLLAEEQVVVFKDLIFETLVKHLL